MKLGITAVAALVLCGVAGAIAEAGLVDVFNMANGRTSLEFVTIGDPGNAADTNGGGAVGYTYQIGKYDVTAAQYCQFLNAVARTDTYGLYNLDMATVYPTVAITRIGSVGDYSYVVTGSMAEKDNVPMFCVSWANAVRFCNWLQNGQQENPQSTEYGAYSLNGATSDAALMAVNRNADARYALPTIDEWYKAAYYKSGSLDAGYWVYPTQSNTAPSNVLSATGTNNANYCPLGLPYTDPVNFLTPVGAFASSPGPYGTYDMGGNVWQWNEAKFGDSGRSLVGGCWGYDFDDYLASGSGGVGTPNQAWRQFGFRIVSLPEAASVPEPSTLVMFAGLGAMGFIGAWRRRR